MAVTHSYFYELLIYHSYVIRYYYSVLHNRCTSVLQVCDCHAKWSSVYHLQFYLEGSWRSWYCNVQHGILCTVGTALLWTQRHDCCKSIHLNITARYPGPGWSWDLFWRTTKLHHICVWNYNESVPPIQWQAVLDCFTNWTVLLQNTEYTVLM